MAFLTHLERRGEARRVAGRPGALGFSLLGRAHRRAVHARDRPVFSFEFFPPKTDAGERNLLDALEALGPQQPDYVSVTYGAGGSTRDKTIDIVKRIKRDFGMEAMAHLTCVNATVDELRRTLDQMAEAGIENVLALRGDPPQGQSGLDEDGGRLRVLARAGDDARAPSTASRSAPPRSPRRTSTRPRPRTTSRFLKAKVDAGAQFLITQMFFDNAYYFDFVERARAIGIDVPIIPGVMPILSSAGIKRMTELCGGQAAAGAWSRELDARAGDDEAVAELGVSYATLQARTCWPAARPASTSSRSTARPPPARSSRALKVFEPWRPTVPQ